MNVLKWSLGLLIVASVLIGLAAGCVPQGEQAKVTNGKETQSIVFESWEILPEQQKTVRMIVDAFEKKYPDIDVTVRFSDQTKIKTEIAGGDAPDCFFWDTSALRPFVDNNHIVDIKPELEKRGFPFEEYFAKAFETVEFDGGYYAMPYGVACGALFYNKSMFDREGLAYPDENWTWDDFLAAAKRLTRDTNGDGTIDQYGTRMPRHMRDFYYKLYGEDLSLFTPDLKKSLFNDPRVKEQIKWVLDLHMVHNVTTKGGADERDAELFKNGRIGMNCDGNFNVDEFSRIDDFEWDVAPIPKGSVKHGNTVAAAAICVSTQTDNLDAAVKFIIFYAGPEGAKIVGQRKNQIPSLKEAAQEYYAVAPPEHISVFIDGIEESSINPASKTAVSAELEAKYFQPAMERVVQGLVSLDEALDTLTVQVNKELAAE